MADEVNVNAAAGSDAPTPDAGGSKSYVQELKDGIIALAATQKAAEGSQPPASASQEQQPAPQADTPQVGQEFAVSPETRDKAKQLGYADKEIDKMSESDAKAVEAASKRYSRAVSKLGREKQELEQQLAEFRQANPPKTKTSGEATTETNAAPHDFTFDAETYGEKAATMLNSMAQTITALHSKVQEIEGTSKSIEDAHKTRSAKEFDSTVNTFIAGLDKHVYADKFGVGDVEPESIEADERAAFKEEVAAMREIHERVHGEELPLAKALDKALAARYPEEIRREAREKLRREIEERSKGRSAPPTGRPNTAHPQGDKSEAERMANVAAKGREVGIW